MRTARRAGTLLAAAVLTAAGTTLAGTPAAQAAQAATTCGAVHDWGNPTGKTHDVRTVHHTTEHISGRTIDIYLKVGVLDGSSIQVGWGQITHARAGDHAGLGISTDGGNGFDVCGRTTATGSSQVSHMFQASASSRIVFYGCGRIVPPEGYDACTSGW